MNNNDLINNLRDNLSLSVRENINPTFPEYIKQTLTNVANSHSSGDLEVVLHTVEAYESSLRSQVADLRRLIRDIEHLRALAIHREFNPEPASV